MRSSLTITIVGTGYVGLTTGLAFAFLEMCIRDRYTIKFKSKEQRDNLQAELKKRGDVYKRQVQQNANFIFDTKNAMKAVTNRTNIELL